MAWHALIDQNGVGERESWREDNNFNQDDCSCEKRREKRRKEEKRGQEKRREEERLIELLTVQREQMLEVNGALVKERKSVS